MSDTIRMTNLGPLHDLMLRAAPPHEENGMKSIATLAVAIGYSPAGLYKMIRNNKVSPPAAAKIVEVSRGQVTLEDFHPYVYV